MENNKQIIERLKELEIKLQEYSFISEKLGNIDLTEFEINEFVSIYKNKIDERTKIIKEIADLRWNLMTPKNKKII